MATTFHRPRDICRSDGANPLICGNLMADQTRDDSTFQVAFRPAEICQSKELGKWIQGTCCALRPALAAKAAGLLAVSVIKTHQILNAKSSSSGFDFLSNGTLTRPIVDLNEVWTRAPIADWDHETNEFIEWTPQSLQTDDAVRAFYEAEDAYS